MATNVGVKVILTPLSRPRKCLNGLDANEGVRECAMDHRAFVGAGSQSG